MEIIKYYGSDETKTEFINHDSEPLMAVIAHDRSHAVVSLLDEGCEHHLLLAKALDKYNIDEYFRIILITRVPIGHLYARLIIKYS